jgi:hypothetical protein
MKSLRSTLALLIIVAVFGAYIYFNERGPIADSGAVVLLRTDPKQVTQITLSQQGGPLALKKEGAVWKVQRDKSPVAVPADDSSVQSLLTDLQLIQSPQALPDDPKNRKDFGLEKPSIALQTADAKIEFGTSPSFDATKVYARVSSSGKTQVALLPATLKTAAERPFNDWRDKGALRLTLDDVQSVTVKSPILNAAFDKTKSGEEGASNEWKVTRPLDAKADVTTVESTLTQFSNTLSSKFFDDNPKSLKEWGLDKPQVQIEVATKDGPRALFFGKKTAGGYAAKNTLSPAVFEVPASLSSLLNRPLRDWRDKKVMEVESDKLQQITVTYKGASKTFDKKEDKWCESGAKEDDSAKGKEAADATSRTVMDLIFAVQGLEAQDFADDKKRDVLAKPWVAIKLDSSTLQIAEKEKLYAGVDNNPLVILPPSAHDSLQKPLDKLFITS